MNTPENIPHKAMVFAAGLGTRMRPITNDRPKAMVEVAGKTLINHLLDRLGDAGIETAIVNTFHFADKLVAHLTLRQNNSPKLIFSREDILEGPLETEGGLINALDKLGEGTILTCNADAIWLEDTAIERLINAYDPLKMNGLLLLARIDRSLGFDGNGDFFMDSEGKLTRRGNAPSSPFAYAGVQITDTKHFKNKPIEKRSLSKTWFEEWIPNEKLYGLELEGDWLHVGDPKARMDAEAKLLSLRP